MSRAAHVLRESAREPQRPAARLFQTPGTAGVDRQNKVIKLVEGWTVAKGTNALAFWALQRDNGSCAGGSTTDGCSGTGSMATAYRNIGCFRSY